MDRPFKRREQPVSVPSRVMRAGICMCLIHSEVEPGSQAWRMKCWINEVNMAVGKKGSLQK